MSSAYPHEALGVGSYFSRKIVRLLQIGEETNTEKGTSQPASLGTTIESLTIALNSSVVAPTATNTEAETLQPDILGREHNNEQRHLSGHRTTNHYRDTRSYAGCLSSTLQCQVKHQLYQY